MNPETEPSDRLDTGEKKSKKPKSNRKKRSIKIFATMIIVFLLLTSTFIWYNFYRPITLKELGEREFGVGDTIDVKGKITEIEKINTTYGSMTILTLDDYDPESDFFKIMIKDDGKYDVGDDFGTTLEFQEFMFNGYSIITSEKLYNSIIGHSNDIQMVIDDVSFYNGFLLKLTSIDRNGTTQYEVITSHGKGFPLERINISLRKGKITDPEYSYNHQSFPILFGVEYVAISGGYGFNEQIDFDEKKIETYFLQVGNTHDTEEGWGCKYIINWYNGVFEQLSNRTCIRLALIDSELHGDKVSTTLGVTYLSGENINLSSGDYTLRVDDNGHSMLEDDSIEYKDLNENHRLDKSDKFVINGLANQTHGKFIIFDENHNYVTYFYWIVGHGQIIEQIPDFVLKEGRRLSKINSYRVDVDIPHWHPELAFNSTLGVSLSINSSTVFENVRIQNGLVGTYEGRNLTFVDADSDSFLSNGDYFILKCIPDKLVRIEISLYFGVYDHRTIISCDYPL